LREGTAAFPSSLSHFMSKEAIINAVQKKIESMLSSQKEHFLVDIKIKPTNNIKVFLDGDNGISIDDLAKYNRNLYKQLEEEKMFPDDDFSLEISSAGLNEPLKLQRQYTKNMGRSLQIHLNTGAIIEGKLISSNDDEITLEETKGKGKKIETIRHTVPFSDIKTAKIVIKF
jgi:ribosome maturation factor RimP